MTGRRHHASDPVSAAIFFAEQLSRMRGLAPEETELLIQIMTRVTPLRPLRRWTRTEDAELGALLGRGMTAAEIADATGRSRDAIHTRVKRLKLREQNNDERTPS